MLVRNIPVLFWSYFLPLSQWEELREQLSRHLAASRG